MTETITRYPKPLFLAIVIGLCGITLLLQGYGLVMAGGSIYYLLAGVALVLCSGLLFRGDRRGAILYGCFLIATYLWAFYEVGLAFWPLMPRIAFFTVLGLWFVVPRVRRGLLQEQPDPLFQKREAQITLGAYAVFVLALSVANTGYQIGTAAAPGTGLVRNESGEWRHYGSSKGGTRYAAADQISLANVNQLQRAWEIRTGVPGEFKGTPIQVGDGLYLCTGQNIILSLDPDSGEERWRFDPEIQSPVSVSGTPAGV